jgi:hypothetical protein
MDEKHRITGFKALLESHKSNFSHLEDRDGSFRLWRYLSPEAKLENIVRDAANYDVPFEPFAEAVRESVDGSAIEEAALRPAMRSGRELHDLAMLLTDDGHTWPPPLAERLSELLNAQSSDHENEGLLTGEELAALREEIQADEAARKREDAHWYGKEAPAVENSQDRDIER